MREHARLPLGLSAGDLRRSAESDWYPAVSAASAPLVPSWLSVPVDANALDPRVWPSSATRGSDGAVSVGGVPLAALAEQFGTPVLVLDETEARERAARVREAFATSAAAHGTRARIYYAGKAFLCTTIARWMTQEGLSVDVASGAELEVALAADVQPASIGFHGNNKSVAELSRAVQVGVGSIIVDSAIEIERLADIVERAGTTQNVMIRVNTGVHAETHDYLATAHEDQKFGFTIPETIAAAARIQELDRLTLIGLHGHIGSQIFDTAGFAESASRLVEVHAALSADGELPVLNLGGGFGIAYTSADEPVTIETFADSIIAAVANECEVRGMSIPELAFEPGRIIIGPAGVSVYEVGTTKPVQLSDGATRLYVSVDGGMSDNPRPALYGAHYSARIASRTSATEPALVRVVGKHCESGDIVVDADYLPGDVAPGDLLAVPATGAYTYPLASNYNLLPRPAVVAVRDGQAHLIVRAETVADVLARDVGVPAAKKGNE